MAERGLRAERGEPLISGGGPDEPNSPFPPVPEDLKRLSDAWHLRVRQGVVWMLLSSMRCVIRMVVPVPLQSTSFSQPGDQR